MGYGGEGGIRLSVFALFALKQTGPPHSLPTGVGTRSLRRFSSHPRVKNFFVIFILDTALPPAADMAERVGFEPTLPVKANTLSRRAVSTTHPPLRLLTIQLLKNNSNFNGGFAPSHPTTPQLRGVGLASRSPRLQGSALRNTRQPLTHLSVYFMKSVP